MKHIVQQGEHMGSIAVQYGFGTYETIWNAPENEGLRGRRTDPFQLNPGDEIFIPEKTGIQFSGETGKRLRFRMLMESYELHLKVEDLNRNTVERSCIAFFDNDVPVPVNQTDGIYSTAIPGSAREARFTFPPAPPQVNREDLHLRIGGLDPLSTIDESGEEVTNPPGVQQRLNNLGYCAGYDDPCDGTSDQYRWAVEEFQCDNDLTVDGVVGKKTRAKITEVYGC